MIILSYMLPIFVLLAAFVTLHTKRGGFSIDPSSLLLMIWIVLFAVHGTVAVGELIPLYPSSLISNLYIVIGVIAFSIGYKASGILSNSIVTSQNLSTITRRSPQISKRIRKARHIDFFILVLAVVAFFLMYAKAQSIIRTGDVFGNLQLLRSRLNYEEAEWGLVANFALFISVSAVFVGARNVASGPTANVVAYLLLIAAVAISVMSSQRTAVLFVIIGFYFSRSATGVPSARIFAIIGAGFLALFILVGILVGKVGVGADSPLMENIWDGLESFSLYLLTPLSAFSESEVWERMSAQSTLTLRFFVQVLDSLGIYNGRIGSAFLPFVYVPLKTNVYTFMHGPISDFGLFYVLYFLLIGAVYGVIFSLSRSGSTAKSVQALMYYPIFMTVFSDQWVSIASQWIQVIVFLTLLHVLYREGRRGRRLRPTPNRLQPFDLAKTSIS